MRGGGKIEKGGNCRKGQNFLLRGKGGKVTLTTWWMQGSKKVIINRGREIQQSILEKKRIQRREETTRTWRGRWGNQRDRRGSGFKKTNRLWITKCRDRGRWVPRKEAGERLKEGTTMGASGDIRWNFANRWQTTVERGVGKRIRGKKNSNYRKEDY